MNIIRTPIYSTLLAPRNPAATPRRSNNRGQITAVAEQEQPARDQDRDHYLAKLVKYVPGEVVAAFSAIVALSANVSDVESTRQFASLGVFLLFLVATPLYFWRSARSLPDEDKPTFYFYLLSMAAFAIWAMAVSELVRATFSVTAGWSEFLLGVGAFFIPAIDEFVTSFFGGKKRVDEPTPHPG